MAVSTRRTLLSAAFVLALAAPGCGSDSKGDGNGDGSANDGSAGDGSANDGSAGDGSSNGGDGGSAPILDDNTAGRACSGDEGCPPKGTCANELSGATVGGLAGAAAVAAPGGYCSGSCTADADCGAGGVCFGDLSAMGQGGPGECRQACSADTDCRDGYECAEDNGNLPDLLAGIVTLEKTCQPKPVPDQLADDQAGTPCTADSECGEGNCLADKAAGDGGVGGGGLGGFLTPSYPGGYCSGVCTADSDCGANGVCVPGYYGSGGECREGCSVDADCARDADGYSCREERGKLACIPAPDAIPDGKVGTACSEGGSECAPGTCASELPGVPTGITAPPAIPAPGGYCTLECKTDVDCGTGGECVATGFGLGGITYACFKGCTETADCGRAGYVCNERNVILEMVKVCEPGGDTAGPDAGAGDAG